MAAPFFRGLRRLDFGKIEEKSFTNLWARDWWFSRTNDQRLFCAQKGRWDWRYEYEQRTDSKEREISERGGTSAPAQRTGFGDDGRRDIEWIRFAEELAEAAETSLEKEADDLSAAFRNLKEHFPPEIVSCIYQITDTQHSALLPNEFVPAAEALQNGVSAEEVIKMADSGQFEGGMMPTMTL